MTVPPPAPGGGDRPDIRGGIARGAGGRALTQTAQGTFDSRVCAVPSRRQSVRVRCAPRERPGNTIGGRGTLQSVELRSSGMRSGSTPDIMAPDQRDHRGKTRNFPSGKSGPANFGTRTVGSWTPPSLSSNVSLDSVKASGWQSPTDAGQTCHYCPAVELSFVRKQTRTIRHSSSSCWGLAALGPTQ